MAGWIKLRRSLLDWEWYEDHNATRLLIHLLVSVNYEDKKWKGHLIKSGSMVYSWDTLSQSVGLSKQQARTAMDKLESSKEVTRYSTNKFQVVSLVKWAKMQRDDFELTDKPTGQQHSSNIQVTPTKEDKELKEEINKGLSDFEKTYLEKLVNYFDPDKKNRIVYKNLKDFLTVIAGIGQFEFFKTQFEDYLLFKKESKEKPHGWPGFIGKMENKYEDGAWCMENWKHKLEQLKPNDSMKDYWAKSITYQ